MPLFTRLILCLASVTIAGSAAAAERPPAFSYTDETGSTRTADFSKHALTAVHFWATWCGPCVKELPEVDAAQEAYGDKGFKVITIAMDKKTEKVEKFFTKHDITSLPAYLDYNFTAQRAFRVRVLPATVFFDAQGKQVFRNDGPLPWRHKQITHFIEQYVN